MCRINNIMKLFLDQWPLKIGGDEPEDDEAALGPSADSCPGLFY